VVRSLVAACPPVSSELDLRPWADVILCDDELLWEAARALAAARPPPPRPADNGRSAAELRYVTPPPLAHRSPTPPHSPLSLRLVLSGWQGLHLKALRTLALSLGESLSAVDLSDTPLDDNGLAVFSARLFALRSCSVSGCARLTNAGVRALTECVAGTLESFDMSRTALDDESLAWLSG